MTNSTQPDLDGLLFEAKAMGDRFVRGDLVAAGPLAAIAATLEALAARGGLAEGFSDSAPTVASGVAEADGGGHAPPNFRVGTRRCGARWMLRAQVV